MSRSLSDLSPYKYRSIIFHGKNSMTDMNLMMIGSTPLSPVTPKTVREEVAYADGDLDLSKVDGVTYFQPREITYTFISIDDYPLDSAVTPVDKNMAVTSRANAIYNWLYFTDDDYVLPYNVGTIHSDEMYDYAYGDYKFINVSVDDVQVGKGMFNDAWVEQVSIKFHFYPYLQSFQGDRVDIATYVDRGLTSRNVQTTMVIFFNNRYYINDQSLWTQDGTRISDRVWSYHIRIPYAGTIGMYLSPKPYMNDIPYEVDSFTGFTRVSNGEDGPIPSTDGLFGYVTPSTDSSTGYKWITLTITFVNSYTLENKPWIHIEWGVLRNYSVPDQQHYFMEAHTKSSSATMYINQVESQLNQPFALEQLNLNEIHITNPEFDGLYKFRYDSTIRRL